jgi:flagellar biosynthesis GTPase FlhF
MAAEAASMQAAGSGGSFGGRTNLANRAYYEKSFVPAQTQLQTNQANELAQARQANEYEKNNLNSQLANMQAQANQQATNQYWNAIEQEKQRQFEADQAEKARQAQAAQLQKQLDAQMAQWKAQMEAYKNMGNRNSGLKNWDFGNGYSVQQLANGQADYRKDGQSISAANFLWHTGNSRPNWDIWNDIWANGVSTNGVGSDTIDTFYKKNLDRQYLRNNYGYLF